MAEDEEIPSEDELVTRPGFVPYRTKSFGHPHPTEVLESCTMSMVNSPLVNYQLLKRPDESGLSDLQYETVARICQRNSGFLPQTKKVGPGERAGFLLGDGTGIGKGRQLAGVIVENFLRNHSKYAIWVTASYDLQLDADKDLHACGCDKLLVNIRDYNVKGELKVPEDGAVFFMTYRALTSIVKSEVFLDRLLDLLGREEFEGTIVFDEAHKAKNFGSKKRSAVGSAVVEFQAQLPSARVTYATATGATDICHLAYMSRLGLWGPGTAFEDWEEFVKKMEQRGVGAIELLALDLKTSGAYISRMIGFDGVTFRTERVERSVEFEQLYGLSCDIWCTLNRIRVILEKNVAPQFWAYQQSFFSALCVASKLDLVVKLCKDATRISNPKKAVVIGLQHTGETAYRHSIRNGGDRKPVSVLMFCLHNTFQLMKVKVPGAATMTKPKEPVAKHPRRESSPSSSESSDTERSRSYSVATLSDSSSSSSDSSSSSSSDSSSSSSDSSTCLSADEQMSDEIPSPVPAARIREFEELSRRAQVLYMCIAKKAPANTLDKLISELGGEKFVAELTGRAYSAKEQSDGTFSSRRKKTTVQAECSVNNKEKSAFQSGVKDIAILTDACSVGLSLHCEPNRSPESGTIVSRQRVQITMELPWSGEKAVQQLGRTNRTGQTKLPEYIFVLSPIPAQNRFVSAVIKRLKFMGAMTQADRNSSTLGLDCKFGSDNVCSIEALHEFLKRVKNGSFPHHGQLLPLLASAGLIDTNRTGTWKWKADPNIVNKFMNRCFMFPLDTQEFIFKELDVLCAGIEEDKRRRNALDDGIKDFSPSYESRASAKETKQFVNTAEKISIVTRKIEVDRGMSWGQVIGLTKYLDTQKFEYFFCRLKDRVAFCARSPTLPQGYDVFYPECGRMLEIRHSELGSRGYQIIPQAEAKGAWRKSHEDSQRYNCFHEMRGILCKNRNCQVNTRIKKYFVLSGSIMRIWDSLVFCINAPDAQPKGKEKRKVKTQAKQPAAKLQSQTADKVEAATLTIAKFTLASGESIIGVIIPANKVELVQEFLGGLCPAS